MQHIGRTVGLAALLLLLWVGAAAQDATRPDWMGNTAGREDRLLPPWTPVWTTEASVQVWNRSYQFVGPLPAQITTASKTLLAAPMTLSAISGGHALHWEERSQQITEARDWKATVHGSCRAGDLRLESETEIEFDGCAKVALTVTPTKTVALDSLTLEIPLRSDRAHFIHWTNLDQSGSNARALLPGTVAWTSRFRPYVWIGDDERGLAWFTESDQGWTQAHPDQALVVQRRGNQTVLQMHILDTPVRLDKPLTLVFGLQATPVRPLTALDRYPQIVCDANFSWVQQPTTVLDKLQRLGTKYCIFFMWTHYYGALDTPYGSQLKQLIAACHQHGIKLLLYVGYGLADRMPVEQQYHDDLIVQPRERWESDDKNPDQSFDIACTRGPYADYLTAGLSKLLDDYDIDGVYYDGTTEPFGCENERHGCGYRDAQGHLHRTYPFFACRDLMKRMYTIFLEKRKTFLIDAHMSGCLTVPTLAFCNNYWDGEQFETLKHGQEPLLKILSLDKFRAEFAGKSAGLGSDFLVYEGRPFTTQEALSFTLLHDVLVRPDDTGTQLEQIAPIWKVLDDFGAAQAEWIPYWRADSPAHATSPDTLISLYRARGQGALLVVSNLGPTPVDTQVTLDAKRLGITKNSQAEDALTGAQVELRNNRFTLNLPSNSFRLVRIDPH